MSEDHHEDDRFAVLNPDPLLQFRRHVKSQCSETHQAGARAERVDHQLHVARVDRAVQLITVEAHSFLPDNASYLKHHQIIGVSFKKGLDHVF